MKFLKALLIGITAAIITAALIRAANWDGTKELRMVSQPVFDRVMSSHRLRCISGYPAPDYAAAEPEREIRRNISRDVVERMGHILGLEIEWVEDVAPEDIADHLAHNSEDAMCLALWPSGSEASMMEFTTPIDYWPLYTYARADDARFDSDLAKIGSKDVTIATIDGTTSKTIADEDYANIKQYAVTGDADGFHLLLAVTTKRADVAFSDPFIANEFMKNNPNVLKRANASPVRVFGESFAVTKGEIKLRDMLNVALDQMQQSGFIRATLDRYLAEYKGEFFYVGKKWE